MDSVLSDGTKVSIWDRGELPMRSSRLIERTTFKVRKAVERMHTLSGAEGSVDEWWMGMAEADQQEAYEAMSTEEQEAMDEAQDALTVAMVKSWSRAEPLTVENVAMLPSDLYYELAVLATKAAAPEPSFSQDEADDPKVVTGNSVSSELSPVESPSV